ncbi:MAG: NAD-dependent epimerase/dehydratase family protein [bacterium JZ-2024 1]
MNDLKLAVTGGAGFLGYHLCAQLASKYDEIRVIDIAQIEAGEYPPNVVAFQVDVRNRPELERVLTGVDAVVHAAASLPLWSRRDILTTNINGTRNTLEVAQSLGIRRVVFISSTAVYGIPKEHPLSENSPLKGVGPYGESKIIAERICGDFRERGLCVPILRPKTFIGTGRLGVFQILYDWVKSGKRIPMVGHGNNRYQLLEVEDLVEAIQLTLSLPEDRVNDTFNIGAKEFGTVKQDLEALCAYAGTGARPVAIPAALAKSVLAVLWTLRFSPLYPWVYATADRDSFVSTQKADSQLGWHPRYSNAQALIRSYQWFLDHESVLSSPGRTHRAPWKQGALALLKRLM